MSARDERAGRTDILAELLASQHCVAKCLAVVDFEQDALRLARDMKSHRTEVHRLLAGLDRLDHPDVWNAPAPSFRFSSYLRRDGGFSPGSTGGRGRRNPPPEPG
jgi:hypothetical protein